MAKFKEIPQEEALEKMELIFIEMESGFHIAIDATFIDQIKYFKLKLPTGEVLDTRNLIEDATDRTREKSTNKDKTDEA